MEIARRDHQTLTRIVALLVALAALAEHAGGRSLPVRFLVLSILLRAEAVARGFVVGATRWRAPEIGTRPADASCLARRFRALAAALGACLRLARRFDGWNTGIGRAPRRHALGCDRRIATPSGGTPRPADTS